MAGPRLVSDLRRLMKEQRQEFSFAPSERASAELNIVKTKDGYQGPWRWALANEWAFPEKPQSPTLSETEVVSDSDPLRTAAESCPGALRRDVDS
jgi:hypothetical protein